MTSKTVLLADDHPILRKGLADHISKLMPDVSIHEANDGLEALSMIVDQKPTVAILDIDMPYLSGLEVIEKCKAGATDTRLILLTLHRESSFYEQALRIGADGYLLKEQALDEIEQCLNSVLAGQKWFPSSIKDRLLENPIGQQLDQLTASELKILKMIAADRSSKEIAGLLFISEKTVESHRSNIAKKLELEPRSNNLLSWVLRNKEHLD